MSHTSGASSSSSPCAACKFLRRKCTAECVFSPYFPADQPLKFANVHRIFGASNVTKILQDLPESSRADAVTSLAFEAEARMKDPVYGCSGAISLTQRRIKELQEEVQELTDQVNYLEDKKRMRLTQGSSGTPNTVVNNLR
ncbi:protein MpASLBD21 [Marchantia polymorpha subsp. ruderalis]